MANIIIQIFYRPGDEADSLFSLSCLSSSSSTTSFSWSVWPAESWTGSEGLSSPPTASARSATSSEGGRSCTLSVSESDVGSCRSDDLPCRLLYDSVASVKCLNHLENKNKIIGFGYKMKKKICTSSEEIIIFILVKKFKESGFLTSVTYYA